MDRKIQSQVFLNCNLSTLSTEGLHGQFSENIMVSEFFWVQLKDTPEENETTRINLRLTFFVRAGNFVFPQCPEQLVSAQWPHIWI